MEKSVVCQSLSESFDGSRILLQGLKEIARNRSSDHLSDSVDELEKILLAESPLYPYIKERVVDVDPQDPDAGMTGGELSVLFNGLAFRLLPPMVELYSIAALLESMALNMGGILSNIRDEAGDREQGSHKEKYFKSIDLFRKALGLPHMLNRYMYPIIRCLVDMRQDGVSFEPTGNMNDKRAMERNVEKFFSEVQKREMIIPQRYLLENLALARDLPRPRPDLYYARFGLSFFWVARAIEILDDLPANANDFGKSIAPYKSRLDFGEETTVYIGQFFNTALREISAGAPGSHIFAYDLFATHYAGYLNLFVRRGALSWSREHIGEAGVEDDHARMAIGQLIPLLQGCNVTSLISILNGVANGYPSRNQDHLSAMVNKMREIRDTREEPKIPPQKAKALMGWSLS